MILTTVTYVFIILQFTLFDLCSFLFPFFLPSFKLMEYLKICILFFWVLIGCCKVYVCVNLPMMDYTVLHYNGVASFFTYS